MREKKEEKEKERGDYSMKSKTCSRAGHNKQHCRECNPSCQFCGGPRMYDFKCQACYKVYEIGADLIRLVRTITDEAKKREKSK